MVLYQYASDRKWFKALVMWCWRLGDALTFPFENNSESIMTNPSLQYASALYRVFQYFGHIERQSTDNLKKCIITGNVDGKRYLGKALVRPQVHKYSRSTQIASASDFHQAEYRSKWSLLKRFRRSRDFQHHASSFFHFII